MQIIGAPAFFPTVWGWIKRWFDPVTVSKIFILSRSEVKPVLEKFMGSSSFPKKYGGELDWNWGDLPSVDEETRIALEKDGNTGWVRGPALWLDHERVLVGSSNGVLRRNDKEIAEKKPIVYAADNTEEPVHPDKRASVISKKSQHTANGSIDTRPTTATDHDTTTPAPTIEAIPAAAAVAATTTTTTPGTSETKPTDLPNAPPEITDLETIRRSPMGDSDIHIPVNQAAPPSSTVEYLKTSQPKVGDASPNPVAAAAVSVASTSNSAPPGHTQPGPLPEHTIEVNKKIASQLEGESTVILPAQANGSLAHPQIVAASDGSKGLAIEADKLDIKDNGAGDAERPGVERFVTAAEF